MKKKVVYLMAILSILLLSTQVSAASKYTVCVGQSIKLSKKYDIKKKKIVKISKKGSKYYYKAKKKGKTDLLRNGKKSKTIVVRAHKYKVIKTISSTCKKKGSVYKQCIYCKKTIKTSIPKKKHKYVTKSIKKATCQKEGVATKQCVNCKKITKFSIPKEKHRYIRQIVKKPTCETEGLEREICKDCSHVNYKIAIPCLEHKYILYKTTETNNISTTNTVSNTTVKDSTTEATTAIKDQTSSDEQTTAEESQTTPEDEQVVEPEPELAICEHCNKIVPLDQVCLGEHTFVDGVCTRCHYRLITNSLLTTADKLGKIVVSEKWKYKNSSIKKTFSSARNSNKYLNCASFVSYCLQENGYLAKGSMLYADKKGELKITQTALKDMLRYGQLIVFSKGRKIDDVPLKKGDVVLWNKHTNIFKGYDSKGNPTWYNAGKNNTTTPSKEGGKFKSVIKTGKTGFTTDNKIYSIIRFNK